MQDFNRLNTGNLFSLSQTTDRKVLSLFGARGVFNFSQQFLAPDEWKEWWRHALAVQRAVYALDKYYENTYKLDKVTEQKLWDRLEKKLSSFGAEEVWRSYYRLKRYAEYEARIHDFDNLDMREYPAILATKCADISIARSICHMSPRRFPSKHLLKYLATYDECWELIEDFYDLEEDGLDWNFNFWIYSYMATGNSQTSINASRQILMSKLYELQLSFSKLSLNCNKRVAQMHDRTILVGRSTLRDAAKVVNFTKSGSVDCFYRMTDQHTVAA